MLAKSRNVSVRDEIARLVAELEHLHPAVRDLEPLGPSVGTVEAHVIGARVSLRQALEILDGRRRESSGAYPPACRECGDFELCVHDVGEEG